MKLKLITTTILLTAAVSGCRGSFESDPVRLPTERGVVTCQLYTLDTVMWDEAISHPSTMSEETADQLCWDLGERIAASR